CRWQRNVRVSPNVARAPARLAGFARRPTQRQPAWPVPPADGPNASPPGRSRPPTAPTPARLARPASLRPPRPPAWPRPPDDVASASPAGRFRPPTDAARAPEPVCYGLPRLGGPGGRGTNDSGPHGRSGCYSARVFIEADRL